MLSIGILFYVLNILFKLNKNREFVKLIENNLIEITMGILLFIIGILIFGMQNYIKRLKVQKEFHRVKEELSTRYIELETAQEALVTSETQLNNKINEIQQKKEELRISRERYRLASTGSEVGIWDFDFKENRIYFSSKAKEVIGIDEEGHLFTLKSFMSKVVEKDKTLVFDNYRKHAENLTEIYEVQCRIRVSFGNYSWVSIRAKLLFSDDHKPIRMAGSINNITKEKLAEARIEKLAYYDELTGLPNKAYFFEKLNKKLSMSKGTKYALLLLDIDNFKTINDTLGHSFGDKILQKITHILNMVSKKHIDVSRFGGDEFILLMNGYKDEEEVKQFAIKVLEEISNSGELVDVGFVITASIGIALAPKDASTLYTLLSYADMAMNDAKNQGKNCFEFYTEALNQRIIRRFKLESDLRQALDNNEFSLFYQPKYSLIQNKIIGFEALIRWDHPEKGLISPAEFIPLAEELGLIVKIGEWVIKEACIQLNRIHNNIDPNLSISINISAKQFKDLNLVNVFKEIIINSKVNPKLIELEITETAALYDIDYITTILNELKKLGVKVSLDDFGTGYSSLNYLKLLPINIVKIDKSFISDLIADKKGEDIIKSIITLSHAYQLDVVAEGVETKEQIQFLQNEKCDIVQGYYISKPIPANEIDGLFSA